jgi:hypothetical protein
MPHPSQKKKQVLANQRVHIDRHQVYFALGPSGRLVKTEEKPALIYFVRVCGHIKVDCRARGNDIKPTTAHDFQSLLASQWRHGGRKLRGL